MIFRHRTYIAVLQKYQESVSKYRVVSTKNQERSCARMKMNNNGTIWYDCCNNKLYFHPHENVQSIVFGRLLSGDSGRVLLIVDNHGCKNHTRKSNSLRCERT